MKLPLVTALVSSGSFTAAHYTFAMLSHNDGPLSDPWTYIRNLTAGWAFSEDNINNYEPYYDLYDNNVRCGRGAATRPAPKILSVNAGDTLAFFATQRDYNMVEKVARIYHEGPGQAYLSRAPHDDVKRYTGDGDWFKIGSITTKSDSRWALTDMPSMNFTIPRTTPPGKYLMRVEQLYPLSSRFNDTQFYIACAQLDIKGPGGGTPGPMVKFPGAYSIWDPSIWVPFRVAAQIVFNLTDYVPPGPPVWSG